MDKDKLRKDIRLLGESIKHWEEDIRDGLRKANASNCPLCEEYPGFICVGCPIREETGLIHCGLTPYGDWKRAYKDFKKHYPRGKVVFRSSLGNETPRYDAYVAEVRIKAQEMIDFLCDLRSTLRARLSADKFSKAATDSCIPDSDIDYLFRRVARLEKAVKEHGIIL
jgi:hypothetical protein